MCSTSLLSGTVALMLLLNVNVNQIASIMCTRIASNVVIYAEANYQKFQNVKNSARDLGSPVSILNTRLSFNTNLLLHAMELRPDNGSNL